MPVYTGMTPVSVCCVDFSWTFLSRNLFMTAGPLQAPQFQCPNGQTRVLAAVSYTNIELTDITNGISADIPDASRRLIIDLGLERHAEWNVRDVLIGHAWRQPLIPTAGLPDVT